MGILTVAAAERGEKGRTPDGYDALYRAHHARVLRVCRLLLQDAAEAEDVVQEVFVAALREWRSVEREMAWSAWLTTVAVHACYRRRRGRWWQWWRAASEPFSADDVPSFPRTPEDDTADGEQRERIARIFATLSVRQRQVFLLRHVEGWPTADVAAALGLTVGSVKRHLFRATTAFRKALGER